MPEKKQAISEELTKRQNDNIRRIRVLEESLRNVDQRVNNLEQRFIQEVKKTYDQIEELRQDLKKYEIQIRSLGFSIDAIKKNEKKYVTINELSQLKNYIDLINPIVSKYVTKKEMEYYIQAQKQNK